jgi:hypothetical protein
MMKTKKKLKQMMALTDKTTIRHLTCGSLAELFAPFFLDPQALTPLPRHRIEKVTGALMKEALEAN